MIQSLSARSNSISFLAVTDSSGVHLKLVKKLRKFNVGILELGVVNSGKMAIPPGQQDFSLSGYCTADCTRSVSETLTKFI